MYTAGLKGYDYSKFNQISYQEALSVVEFWGVEDPRNSKLLMHLSELFCVCEARTYCTVLLRQGISNCLCMEVHIAHPLVQLPAGRELKEYYCPIVKPHVEGAPHDSPQRCTLMWTVSTPDIVRDIRIMAALDEHVDFNHWCVLFRKKGGDVVRPFEYVPFSILFGDNSTEEDGDNADDPDCDEHCVALVHPLQSEIYNINLLPTPNPDEDGLSSLFSVAGDERNQHSGLRDFDNHGDYSSGADMCAIEGSGGVDQEIDEFEAAAAGQQSVGTVMATNTSGESCFAWSINHGDKYASATEFYEFVRTKYCKERQFMIRKASTVVKCPKDVPEGCHPPDGVYSQLLECTLAGEPRKKKEGFLKINAERANQ